MERSESCGWALQSRNAVDLERIPLQDMGNVRPCGVPPNSLMLCRVRWGKNDVTTLQDLQNGWVFLLSISLIIFHRGECEIRGLFRYVSGDTERLRDHALETFLDGARNRQQDRFSLVAR